MSEATLDWANAEIGELCQLFNGRAFKPIEWTDTGLPIIRIQNLNNPDAKFNFYSGDLDSKHRVEKGDLLFAWSGTPGTSFGAHVWRGQTAALNQHIFKVSFDADLIDKRFLRYAINQTLDELISGAHGGVGLRHVTKGKFEATEIAFPSLAEQKVIAEKLDTLLAQVETTKARLDRIPHILKSFRQSVLAAAVSGKLTEDWRDKMNPPKIEKVDIEKAHEEYFLARGKKYISPAGFSNLDALPELPTGWVWCRAEELCDLITKGTTPSKELMSSLGEVPYIKVYNLTFDGRLDFSIDPTFVPKTVHDDFLKRSKVYPGDVLMNIVGPPLGKVSIIPSTYPEWNINQAISVYRPVVGVSSKFLSFCLRDEGLLEITKKKAKATAGQFNLTLEICRDYPIPVPSDEEQTEIVHRVERLFAFADKIEQQVQQARQRVNHLTQSILAKAFRGELTEQWRRDHPDLIRGEHSAQALLEKIRAEREAMNTKKPPKKRTTKRKAGDKG